MKLNKLCISNTLVLLFIIIIIGIYFYKGYKEGFEMPFSLQNRFGNNSNPIGMPKPYPDIPPPSTNAITDCDKMTPYGQTNCNNATTTHDIKCGWNNKVKNSMGGICEGIYE